jgi:hypothetical protein
MTERRWWCPDALFDLDVPIEAQEILVYALLARQAAGKDGRSRQSIALLASRARLSVRAVKNALRRLRELMMIESSRGAGRGPAGTCAYRVLGPESWKRAVPVEAGHVVHRKPPQAAENPKMAPAKLALDRSEAPAVHVVHSSGAPGALSAVQVVHREGRKAKRDNLHGGLPPYPPAADAAGGCVVLPPGFFEFWARYPKQEGRAKALAEWLKLAPDPATVVQILTGLALWTQSDLWARGPRFIARPAKWLRERSWEDSPARPLPCQPENFAVFKRDYDARRGRPPGTTWSPPGPAAPPRARPGVDRDALVRTFMDEQNLSAHKAEDRADAVIARRALTAGAPSGPDDSTAVRGSR